ncbi:ATP-binding protein [Agromyces aerolatus]|uniref:ATP-binding protein n=1 Tax=Agromyces sp. LY-1074 TaxID=3074080 RepID=UPI002857B65E|nr:MULTISPECIES: ATP-binding protein [unclassified Agromyces]MDR5699215.1 ATP-binding protein [Agromyces sp. LY-1074]MDR5705511.1 ATP-binding protein [Agromyces sp. LY-1358]
MSDAVIPIHARRIETLLGVLAAEEPVIALHGPRSVGKSTVLRRFADANGATVIDLDDPVVRDAVAASPSIAIDAAPPLCVDEYQHVPDLLDALKARLNRDGAQPGTAVLTGSTRQDALPRTAQALTGRLHNLVIWPLSQGELTGTREDLVTSLRDAPEATVARWPTSATSRGEYLDRICAGGLPLAVTRAEPARNRWFDDYIRASIERDAMELVRVRERHVLNDVLGRLAGQTAQVLNVSTAAAGLGVERKTVEGYVKLLEDLFLVTRLPAWGKTLNARATSRPKIHVVDSGLAARLLRLSPAKLASLDPTALTEFGHLLETFVVGELRKQISWFEERVMSGHWRLSDADEIDFVIEFDDGRVLAFEVKAAERVAGRDFKALRLLRDALGSRFIAGIALSTGRRSYSYEDRLHVMPIDRLWRTNDLMSGMSMA